MAQTISKREAFHTMRNNELNIAVLWQEKWLFRCTLTGVSEQEWGDGYLK